MMGWLRGFGILFSDTMLPSMPCVHSLHVLAGQDNVRPAYLVRSSFPTMLPRLTPHSLTRSSASTRARTIHGHASLEGLHPLSIALFAFRTLHPAQRLAQERSWCVMSARAERKSFVQEAPVECSDDVARDALLRDPNALCRVFKLLNVGLQTNQHYVHTQLWIPSQSLDGI